MVRAKAVPNNCRPSVTDVIAVTAARLASVPAFVIKVPCGKFGGAYNRLNLRHKETAMATKDLCPEAQRALADAERLRKKKAEEAERPEEFGGPEGPEPVRYGDWERKGLAVDF